MEEELRRSSRQLVRNRYRVPSAAHYVGYVEDNETPEMIMRKFDELDKVLSEEAKVDPSAGHSLQQNTVFEELLGPSQPTSQELLLSEDQLKEVFKRTSSFNVKTAMAMHQDMAIDTCIDEGGIFALSEEEEEAEENSCTSEENPTLCGDEPVAMKRMNRRQRTKPQPPHFPRQVLSEKGGFHIRSDFVHGDCA